MIRSLHRWFGLIATLLLTTIALSGVALSVFPVAEALTTPAAQEISVAVLAARVQAAEPSVEQIRRAPSGRITAYYMDADQPVSAVIDPETGRPIGTAELSPLQRWLTNFHRSLFLEDTGVLITAGGAAMLLMLSISGLILLARRAGGWRMLAKPMRGTGDGRLHAVVSRLALPGLVLSSLTALWMTACTFGLLPEGVAAPAVPATVSGQTGVALTAIPTLSNTRLADLHSLRFPVAADPMDVFTLKTAQGEGYLDQGTGAVLSWAEPSWTNRVSDIMMMLHTGQGMAWLAVFLALSSLGVPLLGWTGVAMWIGSRKSFKVASTPAGEADTIILVGSEGGTTHGFANTLHATLTAAGYRVHIGSMVKFDPERWPMAQRIILMTATHGNGEAPSCARHFLDSFQRHPAKLGVQLSVLGFGDRSFPSFCGFATKIARTAKTMGWAELIPFSTVDRQSPQDFARWGRGLADALGCDFELNHRPKACKTWDLSLISRREYGADVQAITAILRFALPRRTLWQRLRGEGIPHFEAGDLIAVLPEGSDRPRFYSLASSRRDGFIEICVRRQAGGLCSGQLTALEPGERISAFLRPNPAFRPIKGNKPVILIGAGAGIGPLAGFARANHTRRPMHVYVGIRHMDSDPLYGEELSAWTRQGRLTSVSTACSRGHTPAYVQDVLRKDAARLGRMIAAGGQVLVCGGRDMATGVAAALADIIAPHGLSLAHLKAEGRYAEDIY